MNLKISKKVQKRLIEQGIHVVMTREDDDGFYNESKSNKKIADMKKELLLSMRRSLILRSAFTRTAIMKRA